MTAVLVADDDRFAAEALRIQLDHAGMTTSVATSGAEALERFRTQAPRVVLLDAAMPDISGLEVCQRIRQSDGGERAVVIMVSGASTPSRGYVQRCAASAGVDAFVSKPYDIRRLIAEIHTQLTRRTEATT